MTAAALDRPLATRLPPVRGRITANAAIANMTWFRVGGPAEILFEPADTEDLAGFLHDRSRDIPLTVLGVGSNVLVRDSGITGIVVRLGRAFSEIHCSSATVCAGAGARGVSGARTCRDAGIAKLEFLSGIPGTIGGALRMNAGAYDGEITDVIVHAIALDDRGTHHELTPEDLGYGYRTCAVPSDWIFIGAVLRGTADRPEAIAARMDEIAQSRQQTQPVRAGTGGSTFKNPPGAAAWELIDQAGCRGMSVGRAMVSELHTNFLINTGGASAQDLESLGEQVRRRVEDQTGIRLEWEIQRLGTSPGQAGHG